MKAIQRFPLVDWSAGPAGNENANRSWMTQHKQNFRAQFEGIVGVER